MNLLLTGASGFIGSNLVKQLINENHTLFCTLREGEKNTFGEDSIKSIVLANHSIEENVYFLKKNNIDGIIHLASFVQSAQHISADIENLVDSNIKFGAILLETAVQAKVKWFINTGSYWQNYNKQSYSPVNLYAATKEAFMDVAKFYIETNKIKFVTIKLFDTYGANDNRPKIFSLWKEIAKSGEILDMSPGEQIINITYVDDIVNAFISLANNLNNNFNDIVNGTVYAANAENNYTLKQLAAIFEKITQQKLNINWGAMPYKEREVMHPWTDGQQIPGWFPRISIEEGINKLNL